MISSQAREEDHSNSKEVEEDGNCCLSKEIEGVPPNYSHNLVDESMLISSMAMIMMMYDVWLGGWVAVGQ